jgi:hypothetical protein
VLGSSPTVFSLSFHARAHSGQRKVRLPPLIWALACFAQSGCSQFAHLVVAFSPQAFLRSNPLSTVQVSMVVI